MEDGVIMLFVAGILIRVLKGYSSIWASIRMISMWYLYLYNDLPKIFFMEYQTTVTLYSTGLRVKKLIFLSYYYRNSFILRLREYFVEKNENNIPKKGLLLYAMYIHLTCEKWFIAIFFTKINKWASLKTLRTTR